MAPENFNNLSSSMETFSSAERYFEENERKIRARFPDLVILFEKIYNQIIQLSKIDASRLNAEKGTAIAMLLRAMKYAYTSFQLALQGHVAESVILHRNATELRVVALDFATSPETVRLWKVIQEEKENIKNQNNGIINGKKLKEALVRKLGNDMGKISFESSLKRIGKIPSTAQLRNQLSDFHDDLSEFWCHENLFNIARRTDVTKNSSGTESIHIYVGYDSTSNIEPHLRSAADLADGIWRDVQSVIEI